MRVLALLVLLLPLSASAISIGNGGFGVRPSGAGSVPADHPLCSFAVQFPSVSGGQFVCDNTATTVTTTRASSCMPYDGSMWTTQPANMACVGRWGLDSYGPFTQYATNSAALAGVTARAGTTIVAAPTGDGLRVTDSSTTDIGGAESAAAVAGAVGEAFTATCEAKHVSGATTLQISMGGGIASCMHTLDSGFRRYSCSGVLTGAMTMRARCWIGNAASDMGIFDLRQVQITKTPTPMPRYDAGAVAATREGDVHTVSTAGWPVANGEIRLQYVPLASGNHAANRFLFDARQASSVGIVVWISTSGSLSARSGDGAQTTIGTGPLAWVGCDPTAATCVPYDIILRWGGGQLHVERVGDPPGFSGTAVMPNAIAASARIGSVFSGGEYANGSIRLLRVSP